MYKNKQKKKLSIIFILLEIKEIVMLSKQESKNFFKRNLKKFVESNSELSFPISILFFIFSKIITIYRLFSLAITVNLLKINFLKKEQIYVVSLINNLFFDKLQWVLTLNFFALYLLYLSKNTYNLGHWLFRKVRFNL